MESGKVEAKLEVLDAIRDEARRLGAKECGPLPDPVPVRSPIQRKRGPARKA